MIRRLPRLITRNFQLKLIALVVACGMWVGVVYASDPPAISTFAVHVQTGGVLHSGLVLLRPIGAVPVKVAGLVTGVRSHEVPSHLSAEADLSRITKPGEYQVPLKVVNTDANVWIWSAPGKVQVVIDREAKRSIPVHLSVTAAPPPGYTVDTAKTVITPSSVTVTGPESVLANVQAEARVNLSTARTSLSFSPTVTVSNSLGLGSEVSVSPSVVSVAVVIASETSQILLPVKPTFAGNGQPPTGYIVTGLEVIPLTVTATGPAALLTGLTSLSTQPIDLAHVTSSETVNVQVVVPPGTSLSNSFVSVVITVTPVAAPSPTPTASPTP